MHDGKQKGVGKWLRVALLIGLMILCFFVVHPFGSAMIWAMILSFTLHPLQVKFARWMGGRESLAALSLTLLTVLLLLVPLGLLGMSMVDDGKALIEEGKKQIINAPEEAPSWMSEMPLIGSDLGGYWKDFIDSRENWDWLEMSNGEEGAAKQEKSSEESRGDYPSAEVVEWPMDEVGSERGKNGSLLDNSMSWASNVLMWLVSMLLGGLTQITIALVLIFFILKDSTRIGERMRMAADKIAGSKGLELLDLAGVTVKGVVNGVIGTALVQGIVAGIGFLIVGAPGAVLLGAITFFVAVIPIGPPLVWGGVAAWLFITGQTSWGVFMLFYGTLAISSLDNVVRPLLIGSESRMPFALILFGLIGGAMAFGLVGLFVGPTLLSLAYRLVKGWTEEAMHQNKVAHQGIDAAGIEMK